MGECARCGTIGDFVCDDIDTSVSCDADLDLRIEHRGVLEE
jgi:hypothetical protein